MTRPRIALIAALCAALSATAIYAAWQAHQPPPAQLPLSAYAPSGALLAIESPNFAALLNSWTSSAEEKRWLASGNYAGFSRSRLFDRLGQAQDEFAATAGLPPDARFLHQVAGSDSLLAWYDIGNLEFLYITRLPTGEAARTPLLQLRNKFDQRSLGDTAFYVRTQPGDTSDGVTSQTRTVAFAVQGDYLLLATREDLLANALQLMQHPTDRTLRTDAWYTATLSATPQTAKPSDLSMSLNLSAIVRSPYFRSYWIQRNITETKQYTAARADLYRSATALHEERILIPANPDTLPTSTDISSVLAYLPAGIGVYRAQSQPAVADILAQLDDKLLARSSSHLEDTGVAPTADLSTPLSGDASDLDDRIDTQQLIASTHAATLAPLRDLLTASNPSAILTFATATQASGPPDQLFRPIHTAIVLTATAAWAPGSIKSSLDTALRPHLSVPGSSLTWTPQPLGTTNVYRLAGPQSLVFAIQDNTLLLASDAATLQQLLSAAATASHAPHLATTIAGFSHTAERAPYLQLVRTLDRNATLAPSNADTPSDAAPPFFSGNLASLSDTFRDLDTETITESTTPDRTLHQTVLYQWKR